MCGLILASNSPRRRELLREIVSDFEVIPSAFEERAEGLSACETALAFAEGKAKEVYARYPERLVLGADTVVSYGGKILGKPRSDCEAEEMLRLLSGRTHVVCTGVCLVGRDLFLKNVSQTFVTFCDLTPEFIKEYVKSGSPRDKAGAYGIQDGMPVKSYEGSYTNVVGLPLEVVRPMLKEGGIC